MGNVPSLCGRRVTTGRIPRIPSDKAVYQPDILDYVSDASSTDAVHNTIHKESPAQTTLTPSYSNSGGFFDVLGTRLGNVHLNYRALLEAMLFSCNDILSLHDTTEDAQFLYVSPSVSDILGYRQDELVGQPATKLYHPDEASWLATEIAKTVAAALSATPKQPSSSSSSATATVTPPSDNSGIEKTDFRHVWPPIEASAATTRRIAPANSHAFRFAANLEIVADRGVYEYRLKTKRSPTASSGGNDKDTYVHVETRTLVVRSNADGVSPSICLILCLTRDITRRKLREAHEMSSEARGWASLARRMFIRYLNHELRAPASTIRLSTDELLALAEESHLSSNVGRFKQLLDMLSAGCHDIDEVLNSVAGLAALEDLETPEEFGYVDLETMIQDVTKVAKRTHPGMSVDFMFHLPFGMHDEHTLFAYVNRHLLSRAVAQLINNACDHSRAAHVTIRLFGNKLSEVHNAGNSRPILPYCELAQPFPTQSTVESVAVHRVRSGEESTKKSLTIATTSLPDDPPTDGPGVPTSRQTSPAQLAQSLSKSVEVGDSNVVSVSTGSSVIFCNQIRVHPRGCVPFVTSSDVESFNRYATVKNPRRVSSDKTACSGSSGAVSGTEKQPDGEQISISVDDDGELINTHSSQPISSVITSAGTSRMLEVSGRACSSSNDVPALSQSRSSSGTSEFHVDLEPVHENPANVLTPARPGVGDSEWMVWCIAVEDDGAGVQESKAHNLFVPYSHLQTTAPGCYKGCGLGLSMVREVCRLHGGRAGAVSAVGAGSAFYMLFPSDTLRVATRKQAVVEAEPRVATPQNKEGYFASSIHGESGTVSLDGYPSMSNLSSLLPVQIKTSPSESPELSPSAFNTCKVMVVDDVASARKLVDMQLRRLGLETVHACDGLAAIKYVLLAAGHKEDAVQEATRSYEALKASPLSTEPFTPAQCAKMLERISVILMDAEMPFDGYEASRIIMKLNPNATIVGVTANVHVDDIVRFFRCGIRDFLAKPLDRQKLSDCLIRLGVLDLAAPGQHAAHKSSFALNIEDTEAVLQV